MTEPIVGRLGFLPLFRAAFFLGLGGGFLRQASLCGGGDCGFGGETHMHFLLNVGVSATHRSHGDIDAESAKSGGGVGVHGVLEPLTRLGVVLRLLDGVRLPPRFRLFLVRGVLDLVTAPITARADVRNQFSLAGWTVLHLRDFLTQFYHVSWNNRHCFDLTV
ncbi:MAG: hypothetical protein JWQ02_3220 [Capsulimonas sp.]|nr:hypothetical protein [Capsulimonas sp.]